MYRWLLLAAIVAVGLSEPAAEPAAAAEPVHHAAYDDHNERRDYRRGHHRESHDDRHDHHDSRRVNQREGHEEHAPRHEYERESNDHDSRRVQNHNSHDDYNSHNDHHHGGHKDGDHIGPNVVHILDPSQIAFDPHNPRHKQIIENVYSPDYYQPTWILDYRYMKTGGRDYTRADGGQILILPKNVHSHEPKDYTYTNYDELLEFLRLKQLAEAQRHRAHKPEHENHGHSTHEQKENRGNEQKDALRSFY